MFLLGMYKLYQYIRDLRSFIVIELVLFYYFQNLFLGYSYSFLWSQCFWERVLGKCFFVISDIYFYVFFQIVLNMEQLDYFIYG